MNYVDDSDVPDTGAVFTFGLNKVSENIPGKFWVKNDRVIQTACGDEHTVLVTETGRVFCFGKNQWGQLGLGTTQSQFKPSCIKSLKNIGERAQSVACGRNHTLIYTESGKVFVCGSNNELQLGCDEESVLLPVPMPSWKLQPLKMLAAGGDFSAAINILGDLLMWGCNSEGQLGLQTRVESVQAPSRVSLPGKVSQVSCGHYHAAAVLEDGRLFVWGESEGGKLGLGDEVAEVVHKPTQITSISGGVSWVSCGNTHTLAVSRKGDLYSWGSGTSGELGHGKAMVLVHVPLMVVVAGVKWSKAVVGERHSAAISDRGVLYTFGDGTDGKLGIDISEVSKSVPLNQMAPSLVSRFSNFTVDWVSCGGGHTNVLARLISRPQASPVHSEAVTPRTALRAFASAPGGETTAMGDTGFSPNSSLQRSGSLSARERRRTRELSKSMEEPRSLPKLVSTVSKSPINGNQTYNGYSPKGMVDDYISPKASSKAHSAAPKQDHLVEEEEVDAKTAGILNALATRDAPLDERTAQILDALATFDELLYGNTDIRRPPMRNKTGSNSPPNVVSPFSNGTPANGTSSIHNNLDSNSQSLQNRASKIRFEDDEKPLEHRVSDRKDYEAAYIDTNAALGAPEDQALKPNEKSPKRTSPTDSETRMAIKESNNSNAADPLSKPTTKHTNEDGSQEEITPPDAVPKASIGCGKGSGACTIL